MGVILSYIYLAEISEFVSFQPNCVALRLFSRISSERYDKNIKTFPVLSLLRFGVDLSRNFVARSRIVKYCAANNDNDFVFHFLTIYLEASLCMFLTFDCVRRSKFCMPVSPYSVENAAGRRFVRITA